jgi:hypothetical protein
VDDEDFFSRCQMCNGNDYLTVSQSDLRVLKMRGQNDRLENDEAKMHGGIDFATGRIIVNDVQVDVASVAWGVLEKQEEFFICSNCGKVFWKGSHWDKVLNKARGSISKRSWR